MGDPQERDPQEWTKLLFDYYKHVTTLSGVGIAILVTVYHQEIVDKDNVRLSLVLFGLGFLFCGVGMMRVLVFFPLSPGTGRGTSLPLTAMLATGCFVLGVAFVVLTPLEPPAWLVIVGLVGSVTVLLWLLSGHTIFGAGFPATTGGADRCRASRGYSPTFVEADFSEVRLQTSAQPRSL